MKDPFGRSIELLRISVTDRCNYRCVYCMPSEGVEMLDHKDILRFEEFCDVIRAGIPIGINRLRLTGGEPLVRPGIVDLVRMITEIEGVEELAMTTNGSLLKPIAQELKDAGLDRVNISLDTLDPKRFGELTRGGNITDVLQGIQAAQEAGLTPVKLNIVVPDGPDNDAKAVEKYARANGLISRRIQKMDIRKGVFSVVENSDRGDCRVCNRLRLTSNGYVRCCLMDSLAYNVRELGPDKALKLAIANKPQYGCGSPWANMNQIGG